MVLNVVPGAIVTHFLELEVVADHNNLYCRHFNKVVDAMRHGKQGMQ